MLFEVTLRITVAPGEDGVTPEERTDGFKSEWESLPVPMPEARAIALAQLRGGGTKMSPNLAPMRSIGFSSSPHTRLVFYLYGTI